MSGDGDVEIDDDGELVSVVVNVARRFDSLRSSDFALELASRIKQRVPRDRRVPPPIAVAGRVLDVARWHDDHDPLYEMFAELLAKACDREQCHSANPAFAEIVRQLSPDEARLLYWIASRPVTLHEAKWFKTTQHMQMELPEHGTQITSYEFPYWRLGNPEALTSGAYVDHLVHLGLIGFNQLSKQKSGRRSVAEFQLAFTPYGSLFVDACIPMNGFTAFPGDHEALERWHTLSE